MPWSEDNKVAEYRAEYATFSGFRLNEPYAFTVEDDGCSIWEFEGLVECDCPATATMSGGDWKAMFKGIQEGDFELVKYYLNIGIDPNYQHPEFLIQEL